MAGRQSEAKGLESSEIYQGEYRSNIYSPRISANKLKGYGHPIYAETSARRESVIQATVQGNLKWMASRFLGFRLRKNYQGMWYAGAVRRVGWHRQRGYGGTVEYQDGYVEVVPMSKLVELRRIKEENNSNAWKKQSQNSAMGSAPGFHNAGVEARVRGHLARLSKQCNGKVFLKDYQRKTYAGRVRSVVWNRRDGYGVKVIYSDAFEERLSIHEIHTLLGQQKVQPVKSRSIHAGLSTRVVERCAGGWVQEPMNTDMRHELSDRRLYNSEENKRIIKICKEEEGFLHEKYVGKCFYKWFLSMNGVGAEFVGTVTEVWWGTDQKTFFARVVYEDGDREDMSLSELISLVENDSSESNDSICSERLNARLCVDSNDFACVCDSDSELPRTGTTETFEGNTADITASFPKTLAEVASSQNISIGITGESEKHVKTIRCERTQSLPILSKLILKRKGPPPGFEHPAQPNVDEARAHDEKLCVLSVAPHSTDLETTTACVDDDQDDGKNTSQVAVESVVSAFSESNSACIENIDRPHGKEPCAPI